MKIRNWRPHFDVIAQHINPMLLPAIRVICWWVKKTVLRSPLKENQSALITHAWTFPIIRGSQLSKWAIRLRPPFPSRNQLHIIAICCAVNKQTTNHRSIGSSVTGATDALFNEKLRIKQGEGETITNNNHFLKRPWKFNLEILRLLRHSLIFKIIYLHLYYFSLHLLKKEST